MLSKNEQTIVLDNNNNEKWLIIIPYIYIYMTEA